MNAGSPGWSHFTVKSRLGVGRDFAVSNRDSEEPLLLIDGKLGMRPKAEVQDSSGKAILTLRGSMLGIPKTMSITDSSGVEVASLKAKLFTPVNAEMSMTTVDGGAWALTGSFFEREYEVTRDGTAVILISQKVLNVRDTFVMDVADDVDPPLAAAVMWAVDRFVEQT